MNYCTAPSINESSASCGLQTTGGSWCDKHSKKFGGITKKYHELESTLKLDPIDYPHTNNYLNWSIDDLKKEYALLWRIYCLRSKLYTKAFAPNFRDYGHEKRIVNIMKALQILNASMANQEVEVEEDLLVEAVEEIEIKTTSAPKLSINKCKKIIEDEQEIFGIWSDTDVMIYIDRHVIEMLLRGLTKYFERWTYGKQLLGCSLIMAYHILLYRDDKYRFDVPYQVINNIGPVINEIITNCYYQPFMVIFDAFNLNIQDVIFADDVPIDFPDWFAHMEIIGDPDSQLSELSIIQKEIEIRMLKHPIGDIKRMLLLDIGTCILWCSGKVEMPQYYTITKRKLNDRIICTVGKNQIDITESKGFQRCGRFFIIYVDRGVLLSDVGSKIEDKHKNRYIQPIHTFNVQWLGLGGVLIMYSQS